MEVIDVRKFKKAEEMVPTVRPGAKVRKTYSKEEINEMLNDMQNPVNAQKEIAVKLKLFIDEKIEDELEEKGTLSDATRRWIESYNKILEKIQSAIHGDKSVNLHIHKVSHGDIAAKIREAR